MENCIFCKIVKKELPAKFVYEDQDIVAFPDIHPVRPVHIILIPKEHVSELIAVEKPELFQKLLTAAQKVIGDQQLKDKGYRVVINGGGAQLIDHLHVHVMGPVKKTASL